MIHAFTIDVEDYHNVLSRDWLGRPMAPTRAVVENTRRLLARLAAHDTRVTCFVLGEVAEGYPELIREIAAAGHELGVHGYYHQQLFKLTPDAFRREVADARRRIEDLVGGPVRGHRAPAFSVMPQTSWALDVLIDAGFEYDSSIFPIRARRYGWPGFRPDIHVLRTPGGRELIEAPMSTVRVLGRRLPACGGGYLRHFPTFVARWTMDRVERERPAIVYMHPYEIELGVPDPEVSSLSPKAGRRLLRAHRLQQRNRVTVEGKIEMLLSRYRFAPLWEVVQAELKRQSA